MFKKLGFFLFAMGVSASYAMASSTADISECQAECYMALDACVMEFSVPSCVRVNKACLQACG
ncbi:hypothetical protein D9M09_02085 [Janthinobacterium agaricidamnosum]|uniref:Uncharacterized protein n=1 Tax=Janthinobacterium agaricidamnosum TaxID=55508 RepID=A0A3G2E3X4_9BURK|nr:hypothetical protein [Janthinobacterium agaricidamnosum]AYM74724.1 hypothetical protein D9M09_02085 [Janthinobacterium agaricidamnosum]